MRINDAETELFTRAQRCFRESKGSVLLTGVKSEGLPEERYAYDPAGNMIEKMIGGEKTAMTYDLANRLLTTTGKQEARYAYDQAGRLMEEILGGQKTQYEYGLLGKVSRVKEGDARHVDYQYWPDGQTAWKEISQSATKMPDSHTPIPHNTTTSYLWDGLALLARGDEKFTVEPHISGGVPLLASGKEGASVVISDFLGTTLGVVKGEEFIPTPMTAFGESMTTDSSAPALSKRERVEGFFTGKPYDRDLKSYTFLCRNYRPELGRWTAADPSGFPDGANNLAYAPVPTISIDPLGLVTVNFAGSTTQDNTDSPLGFTVTEQPTKLHDVQGEMQIQWQVGDGVSGWIVQEVTRSSDVNGTYVSLTYWEAFNIHGTDTFTSALFDENSHGWYNKSGIAGIFSGSNVNSDISTWTPNAYSGGAPATSTQPSWWSAAGCISHTLHMAWGAE